MAFKILTLAYVSHLQVLVSAATGITKHWIARCDSTAVFAITAVDTSDTLLVAINIFIWALMSYMWRAAVPVSNFAGVVWAVDILNLRGRPFEGACGHVATSVVGAVDKYNLPFIWQEGRADVNVDKLQVKCHFHIDHINLPLMQKKKIKTTIVISPQCRCATECSHVAKWTVKVKRMSRFR